MTDPIQEHDTCETPQVSEARLNLLRQHVKEILSEFVNEEIEQEQAALKVFVGSSLERLIEIQKNELAGYFSDNVETICPGCLTKDSADLANLHSLISVFNNYLKMASLSH